MALSYYARARRRRKVLCLSCAMIILLGFVLALIFRVAPVQSAGFEREMLSCINQDRVAAGLQPLELHAAARRVAEKKARDLYENNYFAHQSPLYGDLTRQMKTHGNLALGKDMQGAGENIARAFGYSRKELNADFFHSVFMDSKDHRDNILNSGYTHCGIALYIAEDGSAYVAEEFLIIGAQNGDNATIDIYTEATPAQESIEISSYGS